MPHEMEPIRLTYEQQRSLIRLFRVLFFAGYCRAHNLDHNVALRVPAREFCNWVDRNITAFKPEQCVKEANSDLMLWDVLVATVVNESGIRFIEAIWYDIILSNRPALQHEVKSINSIVNITYADGQIATSQCVIDPTMMETGVKFDDGKVATLVINNIKSLVTDIVELGLDNRYQQSSDLDFRSPDGEDIYSKLMQAIVSKAIPSLAPEHQIVALSYVRLIQRCIRPIVVTPTQEQSKCDAEQKVEAPKNTAAKTAKGGWDS